MASPPPRYEYPVSHVCTREKEMPSRSSQLFLAATMVHRNPLDRDSLPEGEAGCSEGGSRGVLVHWYWYWYWNWIFAPFSRSELHPFPS